MRETGFCTAADGTEIWWGRVGSGPPIVLCDGFACDGFIWPYVIDELLDRFEIIRYHYRGHGNSALPVDPDRVSVEDLCDDLACVLDAIDVTEPAILMGHSMGVQVILQFFELYPERVRALVPICGTYKRPLDTFHNNDRLATLLPYIESAVEYVPEQLQTVWKALTPSRLSYVLAAGTSEINGRLTRRSDFQPYLEHLADMDLRLYVRMLKALSEHSAEHILPTIDVPTLILAAEHDSFTPIYRSEEMHEQIEGSSLIVIPSGTHVGPIEVPDLVVGAIEKFMKNNRLWPKRATKRSA